MRVLKLGLLSLGFILFLLLALSLWGFYSAIHPTRIISTITPKTLGIPYENISFRTDDHILLRGWFIPNKNPKAQTIILLHGYPMDKGDILSRSIFLHAHYNLLFFDFRYLGQSEGSHTTIGKNEVKDVLAAIHYLHTRDIHTVGVWGLSLGGGIALLAAEHAPEIKALISEAGFARLDWMAEEYYHGPFWLRYLLAELMRFWTWLFLGFDIHTVSPADAVKQLSIPILLIHSKQDTVVSFRHALLLQENLQQHSKTEFMFVENKKHAEWLPGEEVLIEKFFAKYLRNQ